MSKQLIINQINRNKEAIARKKEEIAKIKGSALRMNRRLNSSEKNSISTIERLILNLRTQNAGLKTKLGRL